MTYQYLEDSELDPGSPGNTSLFSRLARNPDGIAAGDPGAPKVKGVALGGLFLGLLSLSNTTPGGFSDLGRAKKVMFFGVGKISQNTPLEPQIRFSDDNGASWGGFQKIGVVNFSTDYGKLYGTQFVIDLETGEAWSTSTVFSANGQYVDSRTLSNLPGSNVNAFQIRASGAGVSSLDVHSFVIEGRT